jgi:hypothetical protein
MSGWALVSVSFGVLYVLHRMLAFTFSLIERAHERWRAVQAPPRAGAKPVEGMESCVYSSEFSAQ